MMPDVLSETREGDKVTMVLFVPATLGHFAAHFPGFPILPGIVQVDWAVRYARLVAGSRNFAAAASFPGDSTSNMPGPNDATTSLSPSSFDSTVCARPAAPCTARRSSANGGRAPSTASMK